VFASIKKYRIFVRSNRHKQNKKLTITNMNIQDAKIGLQVVRAKGDYVVGRIGNIIEIDAEKNRAQVSWGSWVSFSVIEPTSIPYEIIPAYQKKDKTWANQKYRRLG
jgi:hypothetical protein